MDNDRRPRVVILCGGRGARFPEETQVRPKPMVTIGGQPILWHIMKLYSHYGLRRFVLCLGYLGNVIRDFFLRYHEHSTDALLRLGAATEIEYVAPCPEDWEILLAETGPETQTGGRVLAVEKYIDTDYFHLTYGDGIGDVDLDALVRCHQQAGRLVTLTGVFPRSHYGEMTVREGEVTSFAEKPELTRAPINGGFFVVQREALRRIPGDVPWEREPLAQLAAEGQLSCYTHRGFWHCMDTAAERDRLNSLWPEPAPWAVWRRR